VTVDPTCTAPCAVTGTVSFATNDPQRANIAVCVVANGT
jgi:hypothetical protein